MSMGKVVIAIPSMETVHADFAMSLATMVAFSVQQGIPIVLINKQRSRIEANRYGLTRMAQEMGAEWILFIDSDMTFPHDTLLRLLQSQRSIIGVDAAKRQDPPSRVAKCYPQLPKGGVQQIYSTGMAVMLIRLRVFKDMKVPYFRAKWLEDEQMFTGEDLYFCDQARRNGEEIYCDFELSKQIGHLGQRVFKLSDCEAK